MEWVHRSGLFVRSGCDLGGLAQLMVDRGLDLVDASPEVGDLNLEFVVGSAVLLVIHISFKRGKEITKLLFLQRGSKMLL